MKIHLEGKIKGMPEKNKARFDKLEAEWLKDGNQVSNAQRIAVSLEKMPYSEFFGELS